MDSDQVESDQVDFEQVERSTPRRWPGSRKTAVAAAVVAGALVLGGIGVAVADNGSSSSSSAATTPSSGSQAPTNPGPGRGFRGHGFGGPGELGMRGILHGEFVTPNPGGSGYRTVDVQTGEVKAVGKSSITVQSSDGFKKSYDVTENTVVDSGRDGIGTVKTGDTVRVSAVVNGGKAEASSVDDETTLGSIRRHWNPEAPMPGQGTTSNGTQTNA